MTDETWKGDGSESDKKIVEEVRKILTDPKDVVVSVTGAEGVGMSVAAVEAPSKVYEGQMVVGINSDSWVAPYHMIFLDYDMMTYEAVEADVRKLQQIYKLPSACVYLTSKGFHVIFFVQVSVKLMYAVVMSADCDPKFKECLCHNRFATLRITKKDETSVKWKCLIEPIEKPSINYNPELTKAYNEMIMKD
jgi:hypothetical protein